jgi:hypothetical protein
MGLSSGIALAVPEGPARPAAAIAAPNKIPRVKARRSISFIERFLPKSRPTNPLSFYGSADPIVITTTLPDDRGPSRD